MGWPLQDVPPEEGPQPAGAHGLRGAGSRTLRNTALVVAARVLSQLLTLVTVILMNRHLAPNQFGDFSFVVTTSALVTVMIDLGFNTLFQREAARRPMELNRYLNNLISARILFAGPALIVFGLVLWARGYQDYLAAGFVMMLLASYSGLLRSGLYSIQQLRFEAVAIVLESVVLVAAVAAGAFTHQGPGYYLWAYAIRWGFSCVFFVTVLTVRRIARIRWRLETGLIREWFWKGLPFALTFVITSIYFKIDVPILSFFRGAYDTGLYSSAYKLFEALLFLPQSMLSVAFPVLALMHKENPERLGWSVARFAKGLVLIGWPITVGAVLLAHGFRFVYNYAGSEPIFQVLSLGIVFMFVNNAFIGALSSIDRQSSFTWASLWSMVVNVGLNVVLIPFFGAMGAACATVLTEIALGVFGWILTARHLSRLPLHQLSWKPVLAGLVMGAALFPFRDVTGAGLVLAIVGGGLLYGLVLLVLRPFDPEELQLLRQALRARS
jgi:O-antigen/teichoic acid export membrane protein